MHGKKNVLGILIDVIDYEAACRQYCVRRSAKA